MGRYLDSRLGSELSPSPSDLSALGNKQTFAPQKVSPFFRRKRTYAVQLGMSAKGQERPLIFGRRALLCNRCRYGLLRAH
jgi:hypothetical protein